MRAPRTQPAPSSVAIPNANKINWEIHRFGHPLRGYLKRLTLICAVAVLIFQARTAPLALIVLNADRLTVGKLPYDWQIKVTHGRPEVSVCQDGGTPCIHLRSAKASFALERTVDVDSAQLPYLAWRWKVTRLPSGGDFRRPSTDDQAAQVLVVFADHRVVSYIWDTSAPKGTFLSSSNIPFLHVYALVCQSGWSETNRWIAEYRNVADDYRLAYGKPAPPVRGLRIQINSQHTGTAAESYFGEVAFRSTPQ